MLKRRQIEYIDYMTLFIYKYDNQLHDNIAMAKWEYMNSYFDNMFNEIRYPLTHAIRAIYKGRP